MKRDMHENMYRVLAMIHPQDEDMFLIMEHDTGYAEYIHSSTRRGLDQAEDDGVAVHPTTAAIRGGSVRR